MATSIRNLLKTKVKERIKNMEKVYIKMKNIGITNIVFGILSIVVGIVSIWGGNSLMKSKHKLLF